jgi:hypothetical protein
MTINKRVDLSRDLHELLQSTGTSATGLNREIDVHRSIATGVGRIRLRSRLAAISRGDARECSLH